MYKVIGHRGNKEFYGENTISGFISILNSKCVTGIEMDIQVSKDKKLVISHDRFIKIENKKYYIHKYEYEELQKIIIDKLGITQKEDRPLPLFENFIEIYKNSNKLLLIEIKSLPSHTFPLSIEEIVKKIDEFILNCNINNIYLISFDYRVIKYSKEYNKNIKTGLILSRNLIPIRQILNEINLNIIIMQKNWIIEEQTKILKEKDIDIFAWTVNDIDEAKKLYKIGVDYMISDIPETMCKALNKIKGE